MLQTFMLAPFFFLNMFVWYGTINDFIRECVFICVPLFKHVYLTELSTGYDKQLQLVLHLIDYLCDIYLTLVHI